MQDLIRKITSPLYERIVSIISICSINKTNDETNTQTAQCEFFKDDPRENLERWQNYGITSVPPNGSEGICLFHGGERESGYIIATEDKDSRPIGLKIGEVCIYTIEKDHIYFKKDNLIEIKTKILDVQSENKISFATKDFILNSESSLKLETKNTTIKTSKFSVKNDTGELIEILSELFQILSTSTTNTLMGAMPLNSASEIIKLKEKLDTFK
ncbi:MAG: phage baseplate assembly protein [Silvanigrellaceae bacterium]|nr:phage baseplate assembly protein [Silvanigrellaceae bacterium]